MPIISQNSVVIEAKHGRQVPKFKNTQGSGIILSLGRTVCGCQEHNAKGVLARISFGVGIDLELLDQLNLQVGFFRGFPLGSRFYRFSVIHKPARKRPTVGGIFALDQDNRSVGPVCQFNNQIDRGNGIAISHWPVKNSYIVFRINLSQAKTKGNFNRLPGELFSNERTGKLNLKLLASVDHQRAAIA